MAAVPEICLASRSGCAEPTTGPAEGLWPPADPGVTALLGQRGSRAASRVLPAEASASKGSSAYQVHTYPTKIPPAAIEPFILASTEPDGVVLDPFCGSGMTGLAALNTGRRALLSDLAPGAVHLARNHTLPIAPERLAAALAALRVWMESREADLYPSRCPTCRRPGMLRHVIWSDIHTCGGCTRKIRVWDLSDESGCVPRSMTCPHCARRQSRHGVANAASEPVEKTVACADCRTLQRGAVDSADLSRLRRLAKMMPQHWLPTDPITDDREMYRRSALRLHGISTVADFWLHRSKIALSDLWHQINTECPADVLQALRFAFTNTAWHATRMRRYNAYGGQRPLTGTLYIPQLVAEANVFEVFRHQMAQLARFYANHPALPVPGPDGAAEADSEARAYARQSSATDLSWLPDGSIDYVFTDPPFGANLFYADCNIVWEAWLGSITDPGLEIVVNRSLPHSAGGKSLGDYQQLLTASFAEVKRVLTTGARASVVFHNADDRVWAALLAATDQAGLVQTDVSVLDKTQRSMKGYKGRSGAELVPFYDLVVTFTAGARTLAQLNGAGEIALEAVRTHLAALPGGGEGTQHQRSLEYLYSLSVGAVITAGARPTGLSFKALNQILHQHFTFTGGAFHLE